MTTPTIDLTIFCNPESSRFSIREPFVQGGVRYATDGRMMVAVPCPDTPDSDPFDETGFRRNFPKMVDVLTGYDTVTIWSDLPAAPGCEDCAGEGRKICPKCQGHGEHRCSCGCEHDCEWCDEKDNKVACECFAKCGTLCVATWIINRVATLPGVQWGLPETSKARHIIFLKFDGGYGAMMPLDPDVESNRPQGKSKTR
jgi:hypothetical protein